MKTTMKKLEQIKTMKIMLENKLFNNLTIEEEKIIRTQILMLIWVINNK